MTKEEHVKIMGAVSKMSLFGDEIVELIPHVCKNCSHLLGEIHKMLIKASDEILMADNDRLFSVGQITRKVQ